MPEKQAPDNILTLPSGATAERLPLKGRDYFRFQQLAAKSVGKGATGEALSEANQWLMVRAYKLNGEPLTVDALDEMDFQDVAAINNDMTAHFLQPAQTPNS
ncbi:MAG: hypothetical protein AAFV72_00255 [Cyanobacteria bacterium J06635_1]